MRQFPARHYLDNAGEHSCAALAGRAGDEELPAFLWQACEPLPWRLEIFVRSTLESSRKPTRDGTHTFVRKPEITKRISEERQCARAFSHSPALARSFIARSRAAVPASRGERRMESAAP